jgi:hypothetical protein
MTAETIAHLPEPIRKYLTNSGYTGREMPVNAEIIWEESHIKMKPHGKWLKLKTIQFNSVDEPFRIAYMKAMLGGIIPFEGRDIYANGMGHMYGKLGKVITIFDEKQREIAQSALITVLAEALLVPGYALQNYIEWEAIDNNSARAVIRHMDIEAAGVFYFNDKGEMTAFESHDRYYMSPGKGNIQVPFRVETREYKTAGEYRFPSKVKAIWKLPEGDYDYWKGTIREIRYNIRL